MENTKKWRLEKVNPKNYGAYTFILVVIGYLTTNVGGVLGILGQIMTLLGVGYFFMWIWYRLKKGKPNENKRSQ